MESTSPNNEPIHLEFSYAKRVMITGAIYLRVEEKTSSFLIWTLFGMASLMVWGKYNLVSLTWCNPRKLHSSWRSKLPLHWVTESRVVEVGGEGGCGRYKHWLQLNQMTAVLFHSYPTSCSKQGQLWGQTRLLGALFSHSLGTAQGWRPHKVSGHTVPQLCCP